MGTTAQKLTYLSGTKDRLKTTINYAGAGLTNETFREYPEKLYDKYLDILKDNGEALFNGLPKATGTGTSLSLNETANTRMKMSLAPSELEQETTTGKNLAQLTLSEEETAGGITYKPNEDGSITITGTRTSGTTKKAFSVYLEPSTRYYFNCFDRNTGEKYENSQLQGVVSDFIVTTNDNFRTTSSFVAGTYDLALKGSTNGASFNGTYFFSLAKENLTTYEPYTGGIASPNPDYPQDIHTISGDNEIKVGNLNILNPNEMNLITGKHSNVTRYMWQINVKANTTYYIQLKKLQENTSYFRIAFCHSGEENNLTNDNLLSGVNPVTETVKSFTTLAEEGYLYYLIDLSGTSNTNYYKNVFCLSTIDTPFVEHQEQTLPLTLGTLEYCKIGNYEDEFYLATESDTSLVAGKWYLKKNIGKVVFDGNETWYTQSNFDTTDYYCYSIRSPYDLLQPASQVTLGNGLCNNFTQVSWYSIYGSKKNEQGFSIRHDQKYTYFKTSQSTLDNFKTWLSSNNTTVYYLLATPTYTLLNDTLQEELNNIKKALSYQDQTNISQVNDDLPFVISASAIKEYEAE